MDHAVTRFTHAKLPLNATRVILRTNCSEPRHNQVRAAKGIS